MESQTSTSLPSQGRVLEGFPPPSVCRVHGCKEYKLGVDSIWLHIELRKQAPLGYGTLL